MVSQKTCLKAGRKRVEARAAHNPNNTDSCPFCEALLDVGQHFHSVPYTLAF